MAIRFPKPFDRQTKVYKKTQELGFGETVSGIKARLLHHDGTYNIHRVGKKSWNTYKALVHMPWSRFFLILLLGYFVINCVFAILYIIEGTDGVNGLNPSTPFDEFLQAFYFSVQTFTTLGYGHMNPVTTWANSVSVINAFTGLISFALATGLSFAKFSKPSHEILFSENILVSPLESGNALMVRFVNSLDNNIVDLSARITMTWVVKEGEQYRRKFENLDLELNHIYMFPLNWTLVHMLNSASPLYNKTTEDLAENHSEFLIVIKGYDVTYGKAIHTARSYNSDDMVFGGRFLPMYETGDTSTTIHMDQISDFEKIPLEN